MISSVFGSCRASKIKAKGWFYICMCSQTKETVWLKINNCNSTNVQITTTPQSKVRRKELTENSKITMLARTQPASLEVFHLSFAKNITCSCGANSLAESTCAVVPPLSAHMTFSISALFFYLSRNNLYAITYQERS